MITSFTWYTSHPYGRGFSYTNLTSALLFPFSYSFLLCFQITKFTVMFAVWLEKALQSERYLHIATQLWTFRDYMIDHKTYYFLISPRLFWYCHTDNNRIIYYRLTLDVFLYQEITKLVINLFRLDRKVSTKWKRCNQHPSK